MERTKAVIKKQDGEYCVFSKSGKNLGCFKSRKAAVKRLGQIEFFKKSKGNTGMTKEAEGKGGRFRELIKARVEADDQPAHTEELSHKLVNMSGVGKDEGLKHDPAGGRSQTDLNGVTGGSVANIPCDKVIDGNPHFPCFNESQARSAVSRAMRIADSPNWFAGTADELREAVCAGVSASFPNLEVNVPVHFEHALSQQVEIKNPGTLNEKKVPEFETPDLDKTANKNETRMFIKTLSALNEDPNQRKAVATNVIENLQKQMDKLNQAMTIAERLMKKGLTAEEFSKLISFLQEDIVRELMFMGATAGVDEDRQALVESILARAQDKSKKKKKKDEKPY
jgi:hypothetical protein